jgi:hypothetical protein
VIPLTNHVQLQIALNSTAYTVSPTWTDFTDLVRSCSWSYSWDAPDGQVRPSTLRVVASNRDGRWDAATGLGGATWAGNVRPFLGVRVLASNSAGFSPSTIMWRGFLTDVSLSSGAQDAEVALVCTDLADILGQIPLEDLVRPEELTGDRVDAILSAAGIPAGFIGTTDAGTVVMEAATLGGQALGLLQECARAEGGLLWCARNGQVQFRDRFYLGELTRTDFTLAADDIKNVALPQTLSRFTVIERAAVQYATGEVVADGTPTSGWPSVARREMSLPIVWRADASAMARWMRRSNATSGDVISGVTCDVLRPADTTILDGLVANDLKFLDSVDVTAEPVHGHELNGEFWVARESHTVTRDGVWRLDLALFPVANAWQTDTVDYLQFGQTIGTKVFAR